MEKRAYLIATAIWSLALCSSVAQEIEAVSPIFPIDKEIKGVEYHPFDAKAAVDGIVNMPSVDAPFGFTPTMIVDREMPNPISKVSLLQAPTSNSQGAVRMSYDFEFTPAKNGMAPDFQLTYDNKRGYGILGYGWDIELPKIVVDTTDEEWAKNYAAVYCNGKRYIPQDVHKEEAVLDLENDQDVTFYAESDPFSSYLIRHSRKAYKKQSDGKLVRDEQNKDADYPFVSEGVMVYWELIQSDGKVTVFGNVQNPFKKNEDGDKDKSFENNSRLYRVDKKNKDIADTVVAEWGASYTHDLYGNYVEYMYSWDKTSADMPLVDTIYVGNAGQKPHTNIAFKYTPQRAPADSVVNHMNEYQYKGTPIKYSLSRLLSSITMEYVSEDDPEKYELLRSYDFKTERIVTEDRYNTHAKSLTKIVQNSVDDKQKTQVYATHLLKYYNDKDLIRRRKEYYRHTEDEKVVPFLLDRSLMLQSVHNPLGGCMTIDYSSSDYLLPKEQLPEEEEEEEEPEFDENGNEYAHIKKIKYPIDLYGHLLVMSDLRVSNGIENFIHNTFEYKKQSWNEDTTVFYGFETVRTNAVDLAKTEELKSDEENKGKVVNYSTWEKTYEMADSQLRGKLLAARLYTADGSKRLVSYVMEYGVQDYKIMGESFYAPQLKSKRVTLNENGSFPPYTVVRYEYDSYNRVQVISEDDTQAITAPTVMLGYTPNVFSKEGWSLLNSIHQEYKGQVLTDMVLKYENRNNPTKVSKIITMVDDDESHGITKSFQYDIDGNMVKIVYPKDANEESMEVSLLYDRKNDMYLNRIENSLGYRTEFTDYDYHFGIPRAITDRNGVKMEQETDKLGHVISIKAPYELESGVNTLSYKYALATSIQIDNDSTKFEFQHMVGTDATENMLADSYGSEALANLLAYFYQIPKEEVKNLSEDDIRSIYNVCSTKWYEEDKTEDIIVIKDDADANKCLCHDKTDRLAYTVKVNNANGEYLVFADGLGRIAQTKLKRLVTTISGEEQLLKEDSKEAYMVSNIDIEPLYQDGRIYKPFEGAIEKTNEAKVYVHGANVHQTNYYDELYRLSKVMEGSDDVITYSNKGMFMNSTTVGSSTKYPSVSIEKRLGDERTVTETYTYTISSENLPTLIGDSVSKRKYDQLGRLVELVENEHKTKYSYDRRGFMVQSVDEANDKLDYGYDNAGNLLSVSKNGEAIAVYEYKLNQLKSISYPNEPYNDVTFKYGDPNAKYNRVGQIAYVEDAAGVQELFYGNMGEVTKIRRSVVAPNKDIRTYEMNWKYNSLNQLVEMDYPDQENLKYSYDISGLPTMVIGRKSYTYNYVNNAGYDLMGRRNYLSYCNGEKEFLLYDENGLPVKHQVYSTQDDDLTMAYVSVNTLGNNNIHRTLQGRIQGAPFDHTEVKLHKGSLLYSFSKYANGNGGQAFYEYYTSSANRYPSVNMINCSQKDMDLTGSYSTQFTTEYDESGQEISADKVALKGGDDLVAAESEKGYLHTYWYDYTGYPVISTEGGNEGLYINSNVSAGSSSVEMPSQTIQLNRYFTVDNNDGYTKHIFLGDEEVARKEGDLASFGQRPEREERAGTYFPEAKPDYESLYEAANSNLTTRYESMELNLSFEPKSYYDGKGDVKASLKSSNINQDKDNYEEKQYYIHRIDGNSIFFISDLSAKVADVIFNVPFGSKRLFINK